jgi:hypothetical protein
MRCEFMETAMHGKVSSLCDAGLTACSLMLIHTGRMRSRAQGAITRSIVDIVRPPENPRGQCAPCVKSCLRVTVADSCRYRSVVVATSR